MANETGTSGTKSDDDNSILSLLRDARGHLGHRRYDLAVEVATQAIRLDPKRSEIYVIRAEALRKLNKGDRALADLTLAIRLDPDRPAPYVIRAEIYRKRCLFDQAIADATQAIFLDPNNAAAFSIRATCRQSIGDQEGAAVDQEELFRIDPTRPVGSQASGTAQPRTSGAAPDKRFYKGAENDRPDLRGDIFENGKAADWSMNSKIIDDPDQAAEALAQSSGYKPGVIVRPIPRARSKRGRPARQAPWILMILGSVILFGGGLLWAKKDQPKEGVVHREVVAVAPVTEDAGPVSRPEPVVVQTVPNRPTLSTTMLPSEGVGPSDPTGLGGEARPPSGGRTSNDMGLAAWRTTEAVEVMNWVSQDGVLTYAALGPSLMTTERYGDFELRLEFLLPPSCNSGVYLRGRYEVQLTDPALILPSGRRLAPVENNGAIYGLIPPSQVVFSGPNKWNRLTIRMVGRNVSVRMNDVLVVENRRIDRPTVGALDSNEGEPGPIMLQGHSVTGSKFRNISITPLSIATSKITVGGRAGARSDEDRSFEGHTGTVLGVAFSPDGKLMASASGDATVRVWDTASPPSGTSHFVLKSDDSQLKGFIAVAFSPDGKTLAASKFDGSIALWDMAVSPPKLRRVLRKHPDPVIALAFSPDGKTLVSGGRDEGLLCFWDMAQPGDTPRTTIPSERNGAWSLAFSPDGKTLAEGVSFSSKGSTPPGEIWTWDVSQRPFIKRSAIKDVRKIPRSLTFSPDGARLAFGDGDVARVIEAGTGKRIGSFEGHSSYVVTVAFLPDGQRVISGGYDNTIRLWDATTMRQVRQFDGHSGYVEQVAVSPDGCLAVSGGHDKALKLWSLLSTTPGVGKSP